MAAPFYHIYNNTELLNYWILKDTLRDRQTSWATLLFWKRMLHRRKAIRSNIFQVLKALKHFPGS